MPIPDTMKNLLRLFSEKEPDITESYRLERALKNSVKGHRLLSAAIRSGDTALDVNGRKVSLRICTPLGHNEESRSALLFFHGGGWVTESVDTYIDVCINLANYTKCKVIAAEYSLAPEFPFPCALEDCYAAAREVITNPSEYGLGDEEIVLVGDSAGGNLAAAVSLMARDRGEFSVSRQVLIYPSVGNDYSENSPYKSVRTNGTDYILTAKRIEEYQALYASSEEDYHDPYFAPILADDLSNQPDTMIITAEFDPLRDEGEAYGIKLKNAGNNVKIYRMKNTLHGFISLSPSVKPVHKAYELIAEYIQNV
ncbi:MAG: alpha/beta hydrolase [Oscillospiraceae bacterium]